MRKLSLMGHSQTRSASQAPFPSPCPPFPFELLPPGLQAQLEQTCPSKPGSTAGVGEHSRSDYMFGICLSQDARNELQAEDCWGAAAMPGQAVLPLCRRTSGFITALS